MKNTIIKKKKTKEKLSLHPLSFNEAIVGLLSCPPEKIKQKRTIKNKNE